ncbi:MAG: inositol-1-monophosphatase [Pseudomonadales bacterium]|nr:inositol-1-monophosphatase [Pseudomonadales bacterium]
MQPMLNIALRAGRQASQIILRAMDRVDLLHIEEKQKNDLVSEVDRQAEAAIFDVLHNAYPDHGIIGEESGHKYQSDEYTWIIDPLDGTLNFLRGIPHFSVSIALEYKGRMEQAVIIDPVRNEEFTASRGQGAQLNGRRMRVSKQQNLDRAVLATGIPYRDVAQHLNPYSAMLKDFTGKCAAIRRQGSAALDLAYVAAGRVDGYWQVGLKPWDMAAGILLVREAGGIIGDFASGENYMKSGNIVAANPRCFKAMLQSIHPHLTPALCK